MDFLVELFCRAKKGHAKGQRDWPLHNGAMELL